MKNVEVFWIKGSRLKCSGYRIQAKAMYEGESNENLKIVIKIRNTARLSCKLATVILMVRRVVDRWQYDGGTQHDGAELV